MTKRKPARELKDKDLLRRVFPKPVRDEIKREMPKAKPKKPKSS